MYNYHVDLVYLINIMLAAVILFTGAMIFLCVMLKEYMWSIRCRRLLEIKKNIYEMVRSGRNSSERARLPFIMKATPQQFIDIETNRGREAAFFNEVERRFFKDGFISAPQVARFRKIARWSSDKWRRIEAMLCLGYGQDSSAVDILGRFLNSRDEDIAYFSIVALSQIKTRSSAGSLLGFLRKHPDSGYKIALFMDGFPAEAADEIIKLMDDPSPAVKQWALVLLSRFSTGRYIDTIKDFTGDASPEVRAASCDCLGSSGRKDVRDLLVKCLKDDSWLVKKHAIIALDKLLAEGSLPEVANLVDDPSWSVSGAVEEVMVSHIEASLPYIEKFLAGKSRVAKRYAILALEDSGYLVKMLQEAADGSSHGSVKRLLEGVVRSGFHSGLEGAMRDLDPARRAKAMRLLSEIDETAARTISEKAAQYREEA